MFLRFIVAVVLCTTHVAGSGCCEKSCPAPKINCTDCPEFGYDCHRQHASLGLFKRESCGRRTTLKCVDAKAKLFVKREEAKKLICERDHGGWKSSRCSTVDSALCAKPCTKCQTAVPSFVTGNAVSVSIVGGTSKEKPCAVGYCNGLGLTLSGVDSTTKKTMPITSGNLTCTGEGWADNTGKVFRYAVCTYYVCGIPSGISNGKTSDDFGRTQVNASASTRAISCPDNFTLGYNSNSPNGIINQFSTTPLICGAEGKWTSELGITIDNVLETNCQNRLTTCNYDMSKQIAQCNGDPDCTSPSVISGNEFPNYGLYFFNCPAGYVLHQCTDAAGTTCKPEEDYAGRITECRGIAITFTDLTGDRGFVKCKRITTCAAPTGNKDSSPICQTSPSPCTNPVYQDSFLSCQNPDDALIINDVYKAFGNYTCAADDGFRDVLPTMYINLGNPTKAVCTSQKSFSCGRLPWMFTDKLFEYVLPPGMDGTAYYSTVEAVIFTLSLVPTTMTLVMINPKLDELMYYNNDVNNVAPYFACDSEGNWRTPDGVTIVTTASPYIFGDCTDFLENSSGISRDGSQPTFYHCTTGTVSTIGNDGVPKKVLPESANFYVTCGPRRQFIINADTKLSIFDQSTKFICDE